MGCLMTSTTNSVPQLPFDRPNALEAPPLYEELRREGPLVRVSTPAGDPAWLVTSFAAVREVFRDPRFGRSHPAPEQASRISDAALQNGPSGDYETEARDHQVMRKLLVPAFSAPRMRRLGDRIRDLANGCLDDMQAAHEAGPGQPVDLHELLSFPLPVLVICELLGVPYADRARFRGLSDRVATFDGGEDAQSALAEFTAYMAELAELKRAEPRPDVISDLVAAQAEYPAFTDER